jgi:hypothetical protein
MFKYQIYNYYNQYNQIIINENKGKFLLNIFRTLYYVTHHITHHIMYIC